MSVTRPTRLPPSGAAHARPTSRPLLQLAGAVYISLCYATHGLAGGRVADAQPTDASAAAATVPGAAGDKAALLATVASGTGWPSQWSPETWPCAHGWPGLQCAAGRVTNIWFQNKPETTGDVTGWSALTEVTDISLWGTKVSGDVSGWSSMTKIRTLRLEYTEVTADVTGWGAAMTKATIIFMHRAGLVVGDVTSWAAMTNAKQIGLDRTNVTGSVEAWGQMTEATDLRLQNTAVTGDITNWSALVKIKSIILDNTKVTGDVTGWAAMTDAHEIRVQNTDITGDVAGWSAMANVNALYLTGCNEVTGDVSSWGALRKATILSLTATKTTGDVYSWTNIATATWVYFSEGVRGPCYEHDKGAAQVGVSPHYVCPDSLLTLGEVVLAKRAKDKTRMEASARTKEIAGKKTKKEGGVEMFDLTAGAEGAQEEEGEEEDEEIVPDDEEGDDEEKETIDKDEL